MRKRGILTFSVEEGQAATELAVFGAVLIFLIGGIIRQAFSAGYQQNQQLKAMRMALLDSWRDSSKLTIGRNLATTLFLEDRLSPEVSKFGSSDRLQLIAQGSGSLTNLLFYTIDLVEFDIDNNAPIADIYINGQRFPFTTARFVTKTLSAPPPYLPFYDEGSVPAFPTGTSRYKGWEFKCVLKNAVWYGCPVFYTSSFKQDDFGILEEKEAFDINRNDVFYPGDLKDPPLTFLPGRLGREDMLWHWKGVLGLKSKMGEGAQAFDIDRDIGEEEVHDTIANTNGIITTVKVMDYQDGDIDFSAEANVNGLKPGLQRDMFIFTRAKDGTYLKIKEGKLYNPETGDFVRSVSRNDQVEFIQRMLQLSNDTGRFCDGTATPRPAMPDGLPNPVEACSKDGSIGSPGDCFSRGKVSQTCFDQDTLMLYVRSRILDKRGHYWRTYIGR